MIKDTLEKIEVEIESADKITDVKKGELLSLINELRTEIVDLSIEDSEQAESIANFTRVMTHETTRLSPDSELKSLSEKGLSSAIKGFEASHPKLTSIVNSVSDMLSGIGI